MMAVVSTGGFRLEFANPDDIRDARFTVDMTVRDRADRMGQWGYRELFGHWAEQLVCEGMTLSVDESTPVRHDEYQLSGTPSGESLFQRICMTLAFHRQGVPFTGESVFRSDGRAIGIYEPVEIGVTHRTRAEYDGETLRFEIHLELALPRGNDVTVQEQRWEHNEWGFLVRRSVRVPRFVADHEAIHLYGLVWRHMKNPYAQHAKFFRNLAVSVGRGEAASAGETSDGLVYGCTLIDSAEGHMMPAVCLSDPRGREVLVASSSSGGGDLRNLPSWVAATTGGELLVWQTGMSLYLWDGIRVRRIFDW